jgi:hypothetical protein
LERISWIDNVRPIQHLHEVAASDEQRDAAVPGGNHVRRNNARVPVISPLSPVGRKNVLVRAEAEDLDASGGKPIRKHPKVGNLLSLSSWMSGVS